MRYYFIILSFIFIWSEVIAQKKNAIQVLKISEDDDFFNLRGEGTDRGYSSGLKIELYYTKNVKAKFPSNLLMKITGDADNIYGWGLTQNLFTPNNIASKEIQYKDRPYAGVTYFSHILISSDNIKRQKLTTSLSLGAIGKYSFGKEIQTWVHGIINYQKPQGWDNQIKSDVILNYLINYEKLIFSPSKNLEIIGNVGGNVGTMYNNIGVGLQFRAGMFNSYFSNYERPTFKGNTTAGESKRKFQFFFYMKTDATAVMDNSTLQGGFFSHDSSPYTISKDDIKRIFMQYEYGIVLAKNRFGIAFFEKIRTPEFDGYFTQQIGNLTLYIGL
jgi:lipid A 3-O-deacylase